MVHLASRKSLGERPPHACCVQLLIQYTSICRYILPSGFWRHLPPSGTRGRAVITRATDVLHFCSVAPTCNWRSDLTMLFELQRLRYSDPYTWLDSPVGLQEVEAPRVSRQSVPEYCKGVNTTRRPPLSPRRHSWYSFLLEAESTPLP